MLVGDPKENADLVDLYEQMLFQRAAKGIRPVLYISSQTDLECNMLMLLDEGAEGVEFSQDQPSTRRFGYDVIMN